MKIFSGVVIAKKMDKTVTVSVERFFAHPKYIKRVRRTKKYQVHDEQNKAKVGDTVKFVACKPYSKTKKWRLVESKVKKVKKEKKAR